jgi:hypothetical protein
MAASAKPAAMTKLVVAAAPIVVLWMTMLWRSILLLSLAATAFAQKPAFTVGWSVYAGWTPYYYLNKSGILRKWADMHEIIPLGDRWIGGTMILKPKDSNLTPKEIPIDAFFHKVVMLRDRLRVLEQGINSHKKLTDEDKVNLQQYITRCYGSLTTFNVLFKIKDHQFVGEKGKED